MTTAGTPHWDVAAYALGVLDARDSAQFEDHLVDCASCAMELESLLPVTSMLAEVDRDSFLSAEQLQRDSRMLTEMVNVVSFNRSRAQARRLLAVAAGTVVMMVAVGLALFAGAKFNGRDQQVAAGPTASASATAPGVGGPETQPGEHFTATDPTTGVDADLVLSSAGWGTGVSLTLAKVDGPLRCELVAIGPGLSEVISTWKVPDAGYGTAANPDPVFLEASTAISRQDIDRFEVRTVGSTDDESTVLVTLDV